MTELRQVSAVDVIHKVLYKVLNCGSKPFGAHTVDTRGYCSENSANKLGFFNRVRSVYTRVHESSHCLRSLFVYGIAYLHRTIREKSGLTTDLQLKVYSEKLYIIAFYIKNVLGARGEIDDRIGTECYLIVFEGVSAKAMNDNQKAVSKTVRYYQFAVIRFLMNNVYVG